MWKTNRNFQQDAWSKIMSNEQITISATLITATGVGCEVNYLGCKTFPKTDLAHQEDMLETAMRELRDAPKQQRTEGLHVPTVAATLVISMVGTNGFVHVDSKVFINNRDDGGDFSNALQHIAIALGCRGG